MNTETIEKIIRAYEINFSRLRRRHAGCYAVFNDELQYVIEKDYETAVALSMKVFGRSYCFDFDDKAIGEPWELVGFKIPPAPASAIAASLDKCEWFQEHRRKKKFFETTTA